MKNAQLFFKNELNKRVKNTPEFKEYENKFALDLINYDLYDNDLSKIIQLIIDTDKLNSLNIRLGDTLTDKLLFNKLLRKISLKRQFSSLSFYLKNLNTDLLQIFYEFIGKLESSLNILELKIKYEESSKESEVMKNILINLLKNKNSGINEINLIDCSFNTEDNISLLNEFISENKNKLKNITISRRRMYNDIFSPDITNLKKLDIIYCDISSILYFPSEILNLSHNNISKLGLEKIANNLKNKLCTLKKLNLENNYIGNDGCFILSESLKDNKSLISLNLTQNNILDEGLIYFANNLKSEINNTLKKINFRNNSITSEGIIHFCTILKEEPIDRFNKIDFSVNDLDDLGLSEYGYFISKFENISSLYLSNKFSKNHLNNYFIYCQNLTNIKKIKFNQINLTEESSSYLTPILQNNKNLETFVLSSNRVLHDGIMDICSGLKYTLKLTHLSLRTCFIGDNGAEALASALFNNIFIKDIDLDDNKISTKGIQALSEKLLGKISLNKINLAHNSINEEGAAFLGKSLENATNLKTLILSSNYLKDEGCQYIAKGLENNFNIKDLLLDNNGIGNIGADELGKKLKNKENLMFLSLSSNNITEISDDFGKLFEWLEIIRIADNPLYPSAILNIFSYTANNRFFKRIRFKCNDKYLFRNISNNNNLKIFDLSYNDNININLIKNILNLKNISKISLQNSHLNDTDIQRISQYIQELSPPLKELHLQSNSITSQGGEFLANLIKNNTHLKILNLADNSLQSQGVIYICDAIINYKNVISELLINNVKCNDYCVEKIKKMIKISKKLKILSLMENKFTNRGIDGILSTLRLNDTLKQLSLGNKYINSNAFINLKDYLSFNKSLILLEIKSSKVSDDILNQMKKIFLYNKTLSYLSLIDNLLTKEGIISFGQFLNKNKYIKQIIVLLNAERNEEYIIKSSNPHIIFN